MSGALAIVQGDQWRRMTPDDYRRERESIRATYGDSSVEAAALRDQALAALYHRSGWTQEELAEVEGCTRRSVAYRLLFGRFLAFGTSGSNPRNLTERAFRGFWEQTDKAEGNERIRFQAVQRLMDEHTRVGKSTASKPAVGKAIVDQFADSKWHELGTIASHVEAPSEDVETVLDLMQSKGTYGTHCERKKRGTSYVYRIIRKSGKTVDVDVLRIEIEPILEGLKAEGAKNMATMSPGTVARLACLLERLIEKLAE